MVFIVFGAVHIQLAILETTVVFVVAVVNVDVVVVVNVVNVVNVAKVLVNKC